MRDRSAILLDVDGVLNCLPDYDPTAYALGTLRAEDIRLPEGVEEHVVPGPRGRDVTLRIRPEIKQRVAHLARLSEIVSCPVSGRT